LIEFVENFRPGFFFGRTEAKGLVVLVLEMLGQLFRNLVFARGREAKRLEAFPDFFLKIRHVEFR
jgi:hypothetical protein